MAELIGRARRFERNMAPLVRPFDALAESIAYQQLSGKAAATIWVASKRFIRAENGSIQNWFWQLRTKRFAQPDSPFENARLKRSRRENSWMAPSRAAARSRK